MGNALIVRAVPEEMLGYTGLHIWDETTDRAISLPKSRQWLTAAERRALLHDHPGAFYLVPVPVSGVWQPPSEPVRERGVRWYEDAGFLDAHSTAVRRSLETFLNNHLARLDDLVRTGWWILARARVQVSEFASVPVKRTLRKRAAMACDHAPWIITDTRQEPRAADTERAMHAAIDLAREHPAWSHERVCRVARRSQR